MAEPDYLSYIAFVPSVLHWTGTFIPDATPVNFLAERSRKTTKVMRLFHESLREALLPRIAADLFGWLHQRADVGRLHSLDARRLFRITHRRGLPFTVTDAELKLRTRASSSGAPSRVENNHVNGRRWALKWRSLSEAMWSFAQGATTRDITSRSARPAV